MTTRTVAGRKAPHTPLEAVERETIPAIFLHAVDAYGLAAALRWKEGGVWRDLSHGEVVGRVVALAAALEGAGVGRGDRVAILSENRPEWAISDYAVLGLGAIDVPLYPTLPAAQIEYILADAGAKVVLVSTAEQLAKVLEIRDRLPALERVVVFDGPAGFPGVRTLAEELAAGSRRVDAGATDYRARAAEVRPDDVATLIYTSGTTGEPKGVMLTHRNLASNVAAVHAHRIAELEVGDVALSFLPLSHVFERLVDYYYWDSGLTIAYAESIEKVAESLVEVRPHVVASVPRLFDKIHAKVMAATGLKRRLVLWAKEVGEEVLEVRMAGRSPGAALALRHRVAERLVFSKLRARTGGRVRAFISGGAPLSPDVARFFIAAGLPLYEGYGLTETSPVIAANTQSAWRIGTVGRPIPGVEVRLDAHGEILTRGPHVMKGYWNRPEATAEVLDADGWLHTGDIGVIDDDGFVRITDRAKNLIVTAGGKNIAPQPIENAVAMSPYVAQVVMLGDRRPYPILLVFPEFENLARWATEQGIDAADRELLVADPRVRELFERETLGRLTDLARFEVPKKILVLPDEPTVESGLLTPTMKMRRRRIEERYAERIEELYAEP